MQYPVKCNKCTRELYGPVNYCPFCRTESPKNAFDHAVREPGRSPQKPEQEAPKVEIHVSPSSIEFFGVDVGSGSIKEILTYENLGDRSVRGSIAADADFLKVTPTELSQQTCKIEVTLDTGKLELGRSYSQCILIGYNGADGPVRIPVAIRVNPRKPPPPEETPALRCDTTAVNFIDVKPNSGIINRKLSCYKTGNQDLAGTVTSEAPNIFTVNPSSLSPEGGSFEVGLDTSTLKWGRKYNPHIRIDYNGEDSPVRIPVNINVVRQKSRVKYFLLLFLLVSVAIWVIIKTFPSTPPPPPPPIDHVVAVKNNKVNVRGGPSAKDKILGAINVQRGQSVGLVDAKGDWYWIRTDIAGMDPGWVNKIFFLRKSDVAEALAAKGYGFLNVWSDANRGIGVAGTVKSDVDKKRVLEILSKFGGLVDTSELKVEPPPSPTPALVKEILANRGYPNLQVSLLDDRFIVEGEVETNQDIEKVGQLISSIPDIKNYENRVKVKETPTPPPPPRPSPPQAFAPSVPPQIWSAGVEQIQRMINYASGDGGVTRDREIADAKRRIEELGVRNALPAVNRVAARAANKTGLEEQRKGRNAEAFNAFSEAYKADPGDVEVTNNLGYNYMVRGDASSAERAATLTLLLAPNRSGAWAILGYLYAKQGKESAAVACFANTYRYSTDTGKTRQFFKNLSETDGDSNVRAAARAALDLPLLRGQPLDPGGKQNKKFTGLDWIVHRMKTLLQSSGYGDITVEQTGPQEITLGGVVRSEEESVKVREIAGKEARGKAINVKWDFQIKR